MASLDAVAAEAAYRARRRYGKVTEAKLERWYGGDCVDTMQFAGSGCYVPVPIAGLPAAMLRGEVVNKPWWEIAANKFRRDQRGGFASLSDLIAEATAGKKQSLPFDQVGTTGVISVSNWTWGVGPIPAAGAAAAAPPGGTVPIRTTTGALGQQNAGGADTLHITGLTAVSTQIGTVMLLDKLFATTTAANPGVGSIAVTGLQNRYTGAAGTPEYAAGCVISNRVTVLLAALAHNITYTYIDQDNNAGASSGAMAGRSAAAVNQTDLAVGVWAAGLAGGDTGVRQLTAIQFSASPATGQVEHRVVRPLAICPVPVANVAFILDGINSAFNLIKVMTDAALTFGEFFKTATTAATISGTVEMVSG